MITLQFVHTSKKRTLQSAKAFVEGMFSVNRSTEIVSDFQSPDDDLLRVSNANNCIHWK